MKKLLVILATCLFLAPVAFAQEFVTLLQTGTPAQVQAAIAGGAKVNDTIKGYGETPLIIAAEKNPNPEVITTLLKAGAGLNDESTAVATPLMSAARNPNPDVVSLFLKAGAKDRPNIPPGMAAVWTAFEWAAGYNSNPEVITMLLKAGGRIEEKDGENWTPLLWAARWNPNPEVITNLLNAGLKLTTELTTA